MSDDREFYVGYLPTPPRLRGFLRGAVLIVAGGAALLAGAAGALQRPLPTGVFEFGVTRTFEGVLRERPLPTLAIGDGAGTASFLLVGFGKHGLPEWARGSDGKRVRFAGSLIYREGLAMIEMNDRASFTVLGDATVDETPHRVQALGEITAIGEIVDTKCYFGVMRPATGKVHRACAIRCISGGVPPGLLVRTAGDDGLVVVLAGPPGRPLEWDIQWTARTVRARGGLELHDGIPVLRVTSLELVGEA